jgi:hypothetical protein
VEIFGFTVVFDQYYHLMKSIIKMVMIPGISGNNNFPFVTYHFIFIPVLMDL